MVSKGVTVVEYKQHKMPAISKRGGGMDCVIIYTSNHIMEELRAIGIVEANVFAIIVLMMIYLNMKRYIYKYDFEQKVYTWLILSNSALLIIDIVRLYINGKTNPIYLTLNLIFTTLMIVFTPTMPMLWTIYIDYKIFIDKSRIKKNIIYITLPVIINIIFTIVSLFGGLKGKSIFNIDENNVYHRGDLYGLMVIMSYSYLVYSFSVLIKNKDLIDLSEYKSLRLFAIPPFIGGILQSLIFGLKLTWLSMALSMFIIFLYVQNNLLHIDMLTGLYNRRQLERYLKVFFDKRKGSSPKKIGGVLLDVNDFKYINDTFGHNEGDKALCLVAEILRKGFDKDDFIFRYAGDEFVVLCNTENWKQLKNRIDNLNKVIEEFNQDSKLPYNIEISKGYSLFENSVEITEDLFIKKIDKLMYDDKDKNKKKE